MNLLRCIHDDRNRMITESAAVRSNKRARAEPSSSCGEKDASVPTPPYLIAPPKVLEYLKLLLEEPNKLFQGILPHNSRMMESAFSLMQMAKTSAKLTLLARAGLPYFSLMTDPTTGGVTASFAMLGDINLAETGALIGFAGPRVIRETINRDLPEGFQTAEFLLENGFVDLVVNRKDLKETVGDLLALFAQKRQRH